MKSPGQQAPKSGQFRVELVPIASTHVVRIRNVSKRCVNGKVFLLVTETVRVLFRRAVSGYWFVEICGEKLCVVP